jgi:hypothetical protein
MATLAADTACDHDGNWTFAMKNALRESTNSKAANIPI